MTHFFDTDLMPRMNVATAPATNIKMNDKSYTMEVAAPGLRKEWVRINTSTMTAISASLSRTRWNIRMKTSTSTIRAVVSYSNYQQSYTLPEDADREHISAKVADGCS